MRYIALKTCHNINSPVTGLNPWPIQSTGKNAVLNLLAKV
jgi:hypothetical protein